MKPLLILILHFLLELPACFFSPINLCGVQNTDCIKAKSLADKILRQISSVEISCEISFEPKKLELMKSILEIPPAPRISESQPTEVNLQRIAEGMELYRHLLQDITEKLKCSRESSGLLADISELMQEVQRLVVLSPSDTHSRVFSMSERLADDQYKLKVALQLILMQFRPFTQNTLRTLRYIMHTRTSDHSLNT